MPAALLLLVALLVGLLVSCLHMLLGHPLAGIPGPRLAAVSRLWYALQVRNGRLLQLATTLHRTYGPAVRVAPNEVWLSSPEAFGVIYRACLPVKAAQRRRRLTTATLLDRPPSRL